MTGQLSCSVDRPRGAHVIQLPDAEADIALVRKYTHELRSPAMNCMTIPSIPTPGRPCCG